MRDDHNSKHGHEQCDICNMVCVDLAEHRDRHAQCPLCRERCFAIDTRCRKARPLRRIWTFGLFLGPGGHGEASHRHTHSVRLSANHGIQTSRSAANIGEHTDDASFARTILKAVATVTSLLTGARKGARKTSAYRRIGHHYHPVLVPVGPDIPALILCDGPVVPRHDQFPLCQERCFAVDTHGLEKHVPCDGKGYPEFFLDEEGMVVRCGGKHARCNVCQSWHKNDDTCRKHLEYTPTMPAVGDRKSPCDQCKEAGRPLRAGLLFLVPFCPWCDAFHLPELVMEKNLLPRLKCEAYAFQEMPTSAHPLAIHLLLVRQRQG